MLSQSEWNRPLDSVLATSRRPAVIDLAGPREVLRRRLGEVVVVDEVVAGVVGRVDVDQLDLAEVRLLEQLERVEVVALDEEVLRRVEVDRLLADRPERLGDRCIGREGAARLPGQSSW